MVKNVLLTGTGGFVGSALQLHFQGKYNILAPRSSQLNLTDFEEVRKYFSQNEIDFVVHCANKGGARGVLDDRSVVEDNLKMFHNLKNCLGKKRMITFGSGAQYEKARPLKKVSEKSLGELIPQDPYGYSKYLQAQEVLKTDNVLCLNIFGSYGKGEKNNRFPSDAITKNIQSEPIVINQNVVFDYLYIEDLCKIVEYFVENKPKERIINITPTQSISLLEIAQIVNEISDFESEIVIKNSELNNEYTGDNSILLKEIEGFEFTSYKEGLKVLFEYLKGVKSFTASQTKI